MACHREVAPREEVRRGSAPPSRRPSALKHLSLTCPHHSTPPLDNAYTLYPLSPGSSRGGSRMGSRGEATDGFDMDGMGMGYGMGGGMGEGSRTGSRGSGSGSRPGSKQGSEPIGEAGEMAAGHAAPPPEVMPRHVATPHAATLLAYTICAAKPRASMRLHAPPRAAMARQH